MAGKTLREVRKAAVLKFSWDFVRKLETRTREDDQAGFEEHLKTLNLEGKRDRSSAYFKDENGVLLRDVELIRERWVLWFHTLLNAESSRLDPNIAEGLDQWPENMPLGVQPMMQELTSARWRTERLSDRTESPLSCSRSSSTAIPPCAGDCSISSFVFGGGAKCRSNGMMPSPSYSTERRIGQSAATTGASRYPQSSFNRPSICRRPDSHTCFLFLFGDVAFSEYFLYHFRFLFVWRVRRTFFPSEWCFSTL